MYCLKLPVSLSPRFVLDFPQFPIFISNWEIQNPSLYLLDLMPYDLLANYNLSILKQKRQIKHVNQK